MMELTLNPSSISDYRRFLEIKRLPRYQIVGRTARIPDEYAGRVGLARPLISEDGYRPHPGLFDYQAAIARLAIEKRKFGVFADCGVGKSLVELEFARHVAGQLPDGKAVLIVTPLMVIGQLIDEARRFYGGSLPIRQVRANELGRWLVDGTDRIGITNYDALVTGLPRGRLAGLILDESSMLKSHYGKWGQVCIDLGRGLEWKLAATGTPAPNDRIEYANHAVFLDAFPTVNSFLARFFVNRGQTENRWELKPHALMPFYRALSDWCIFLTNPATYGWRDNVSDIPPIRTHIHDIDLTDEQLAAVRSEFGDIDLDASPGGIGSRSKMSRIAKGRHGDREIATNKTAFVRSLVDSWPGESTIIWCVHNDEQELMERTFPGAASIAGNTPIDRRMELIGDFKAGRRKVLISKSKVLGFGLNLQVATRMIFSSLVDSYESYYQCVKRANRIGSTRELNVHIPITRIERPMVETVLRKAARVQEDTRMQEELFRAAC